MRRLLIVIMFMTLALAAVARAGSSFPAKEVYEEYSPSVVLILSSKGEGMGTVGAGSVISTDGYIITNAHVVIDSDTGKPYKSSSVFLKPESVTGDPRVDLKTRLEVEVVSYSSDLDLALIKVSGLPAGLKTIELANPGDIKVGEDVIAIGHPEQGGLWSLTYGMISGEIRNQSGVEGKDVYQTDTSVNRGNSGGPLLDRRGYMVAINTNIARLGADGIAITGVNFSIKSSVVKVWLKGHGFIVAYGQRPLYEDEGRTSGPAASTASGGAEPREEQAEPEARPEPEASEVKVEPAPAEKAPAVAGGVKASGTVKATAGDEGKGDNNGDKLTKELDRKFSTPEKPYEQSDLLKAVERDLEGIMDEMKGKIRSRQ